MSPLERLLASIFYILQNRPAFPSIWPPLQCLWYSCFPFTLRMFSLATFVCYIPKLRKGLRQTVSQPLKQGNIAENITFSGNPIMLRSRILCSEIPPTHTGHCKASCNKCNLARSYQYSICSVQKQIKTVIWFNKESTSSFKTLPPSAEV